MKKIPIVELNCTRWIETDRIMWFEADGNSTRIFLIDGPKIISTKILKYYSDMLHENGYYRIHDKFLINLKYVDSHTRGKRITVRMVSSGRQCCWDNTEIEVSCRNRSAFLDFMKKQVSNTLISKTATLIRESDTLIEKERHLINIA